MAGLSPDERDEQKQSPISIKDITGEILSAEMDAMQVLEQAVVWSKTFVNAYGLLESAAQKVEEATEAVKREKSVALLVIADAKSQALKDIAKAKEGDPTDRRAPWNSQCCKY